MKKTYQCKHITVNITSFVNTWCSRSQDTYKFEPRLDKLS